MATDGVRGKYEAAGQDHVFKWIDEGKLSAAQTEELMAQLDGIDLDRVAKLYTDTMAAHSAGIDVSSMARVSNSTNIGSCAPEEVATFRWRGLKAIADGEVGVILLAGGQGTRLGFDKPKGMYDIGLPSHDTLFHMQGKQITRLRELAAAQADVPIADVHLPWYVMTSPQTDEATRAAFEDNDFYTCPKEDVVFFSQGTLPCLTMEGKIIMKSGHEVATAPDGNGGIYLGLLKSGALADMKSRGLKYLPQYCVDNACCKVADPVLIGFSISKDADVGGKAVAKVAWDEKVGVFCLVNGEFSVVEYSDISEEAAQKTESDGQLTFSAGHVCINFYTVPYLDNVCANLPSVYHVAKKKIPYADDAGETVKPEENNGMKLESFIMDVFPLAKSPAVMEVPNRVGEFAPVKNAPGSAADSPDQARAMVSDQCRDWLRRAGGTIVGDGLVSVDPLLSYSGEGLEAVRGKVIETPCQVVPAPAGSEPGLTAGPATEAGDKTYYLGK